MNTRRAACAALLALAALTAGCSSASTDDKPSKAESTTAAATPTVDAVTDRAACVDAVKAAVDADTDDIKPDECASLSESDYLKAYMEGLEQHNQEGREDLQDLIDEASENAQP